MICSFDGNGGLKTATGGEIEYNISKMPENNKFSFYGSSFSSTITWNFSICKNLCRKGDYYFDQYEESMIKKWLVKTDGYKMMQFDQDGYEDIYYNVCFNAVPHQHLGKTIGFDLTATSDCAYGFTDIIKKKAIIDSKTPLKFNVHSDVMEHILPITNVMVWDSLHEVDKGISVWNDAGEGKPSDPMTFKNISGNHITIDSSTKTVIGLNSPDDFNWNYLKLRDGLNVISTGLNSGMIEIEILYRETRLITV